jgi:hypothetical protein
MLVAQRAELWLGDVHDVGDFSPKDQGFRDQRPLQATMPSNNEAMMAYDGACHDFLKFNVCSCHFAFCAACIYRRVVVFAWDEGQHQ